MGPKDSGKRSITVTVKISPADLELINKAAEMIWPGALVTQSGKVLGFARLQAEQILEQQAKKSKT